MGMADAEKELENRLMDLGARLGKSPPSDVEGLLDLLDQTESFLTKVDQSPSPSMSTSLHPATNALVAKELLEHSDLDVKVAVASCISEITRITAPDAPYNDELMKVVFQRIVEAFEKLDDMSSRSYSKRVSILETVAKVRSCVVMLDLECDALILEMFNHFLRAIRSAHPENVISSMETIMILVLDESEDISSDLLSCLLSYVKKDNMDVSTIAKQLVERVISKCALKLKPYLVEVIQMMGTSSSQYSKIVSSACHRSSDDLEHSDVNASGEDLAADSKLSDRTVSDELPQESEMLERGICPEVGSKSPKSGVSNGSLKVGNGDTLVNATSSDQKVEHSRCSSEPKEVPATVGTEGDNSEPVAGKVSTVQSTKRKRGMKSGSSSKLMDKVDQAQSDSDKAASPMPSRRKSQDKDACVAESNLSGKEAELTSSETERKDELQLPVASENGTTQVGSPTADAKLAEETRPRRGRPAKTRKGAANATGDHPVQQPRAKVDSGNDRMSEADGKSDSEGKSLRHSAKKVNGRTAGNTEMPAVAGSGSGAKRLRKSSEKGSIRKVLEEESPRKQKNSNIQQLKGKNALEEDEAKEMSLKEMVSSPKSLRKALRKENSNLKEGMNTNSGRKRARGAEEVSESSEHGMEPDEKLVGSRIKVWWPEDKMFYEGVIKSFNPGTKKHKVVYTDGDVEKLALKEEQWKLLNGKNATVRGQAKDSSSPDSAKTPHNKKAKTSAESVPRQAKSGGSSRGKSRGRNSRSRSAGDTPRPRGRPRSSSTKVRTPSASKLKQEPRGNSKDETSKTSKDDSAKSSSDMREDSPKDGSASINDMPDSDDKLKEDSVATVSKSKDETPATGGPLKAGRKSKAKSTPVSVDRAKTNGGLAKDDLKVEESDRPSAKVQSDPESEARTGKKRRRKSNS